MSKFSKSPFSRNRPTERGVTILLICVAMLFMVLAIAAIAIDVGAMYSARGEAKHAADAAALAGAKVLADSGMTSDPNNPILQNAAVLLAKQVATSVGAQNMVGGRLLLAAEVSPSIDQTSPDFAVAPRVSVTVQRTDLPTFFAKAWGRTTIAVGATSVAEVVNPSNSGSVTLNGNPIPIALNCVKPWIIPNLDPNNAASPFFDPTSGQIVTNGQVGTTLRLSPACPPVGCSQSPTPSPMTKKLGGKWYVQYVPGAETSPAANQQPACTPSGCTNTFEQTIAGCSPDIVACGIVSNATADLSKTCSDYHASTDNATSCLIHSAGGIGQDTINVGAQPLQFLAGTNNPLVVAGKISATNQISSSDSLVTIPVYDQTQGLTPQNNSPVNVIGFIQGFVQSVTPNGRIVLTIVNISGCGVGATGSPVVGNGLSPVPVHLIYP